MPGNSSEESTIGQGELIAYVNASPLAAAARRSATRYCYEYTLSPYCCISACIARDNDLCPACHCCRDHCSPHTHLWQARLHMDFPLPGRHSCGYIPELERACELDLLAPTPTTTTTTPQSSEEQSMPLQQTPTPVELAGERFCDNCHTLARDLEPGELLHPMHRPANQNWCDTCLRTVGFTCTRCARSFRDSYANDVQGRTGGATEIVCDSCVASRCYSCERCDSYFYRNLSHTWAGRTVCPSCYEDGCTCNDCGEEYFDGDDHECPSSDDDDYDSDDERDGASAYIHNYGYRPARMIFLGDPKDDIYLGVELEVEVPRQHSRGELADDVGSAMSGFAYLKSDGSLTNGFEIVTHPASLDVHKEEWPRLFYSKSFVKKLRSWDPGTCGLHVHISRRPISKLTQAKMVAFCNLAENRPWLIQLAGRESAQYAKFKTVYELGRAIRGSDERYEVLNVNNRETLEFRLFKGSLRPERLWRALEFAHSLVYFCRASGLHELRYTDYLHWLGKHRKDYPAMAEWALPKTAKLPAAATANSHPDAVKDLGQDAEVRAAKLAAKEAQAQVVTVEEPPHGVAQPDLVSRVLSDTSSYGNSVESYIRMTLNDAQRYYRDPNDRLQYLRQRAELVFERVERQTRSGFRTCGESNCSCCDYILQATIREAKERVKQLFGFGGTELLDWWERWDLAERGIIPRQTPQWFINQQEERDRIARERAAREAATNLEAATNHAASTGAITPQAQTAFRDLSSAYERYFGLDTYTLSTSPNEVLAALAARESNLQTPVVEVESTEPEPEPGLDYAEADQRAYEITCSVLYRAIEYDSESGWRYRDGDRDPDWWA